MIVQYLLGEVREIHQGTLVKANAKTLWVRHATSAVEVILQRHRHKHAVIELPQTKDIVDNADLSLPQE